MSELAQQTVVIVGASSGIGLATARAAGQEGARVVLMGRSREKLEGATRAVGGASQAVAVDMLDPEAVGVLALELAPRRVNVVMPGVVDTPLHGHRREQLQRWAESPDLPTRHFGQPEDIARAILFLMTDRYVTGHTLVVDGGLLLT